ncbi:acyltransferase [Novosphingobium sp. ZN18A2]|uniref:acyltransferase family protein n=1 Tax=Novosphingobium sp. ZN18A2 TaxID=3079861 RepID=UPI0030D09165
MTPPRVLRLEKRHFDTLDLTRMLAAVAVLFWHYQHFFVPDIVPYGFQVNRAGVEPLHRPFALLYDHGHVAVQYFWAVSGFVFAHVYLADPHSRSRFWPARIARLWPLHLLTLCIVALFQAGYLVRNGHYFIYAWNDARHFVLNLFLAQYWGFQQNQSFNGPAWSLSTEIVAYAAFWLLLPVLRRAPGTVAGLLAATTMTLVLAGAPNETVLSCIAYFFGGAGVYALALKDIATPARLVAAAPGLALAAWAAWTFWRSEELATGAATFAVLALAVAVDLADTRRVMRFGKRLGDASYGIYLWHFPLQLLLVLAIPGVQAAAGRTGFLVFFIACSIMAGFASHALFERPAQRAVLRLFDRLRQRRAAAA